MEAAAGILGATSHRPWALPGIPWVLSQSWRTLLFAHWRMDPESIRAHVPPELDLDLRDGAAWVGITPFRLTDFRPRMLPALPMVSEFPELNLRTYVRAAGRPAIYFFSLDAGSAAAVMGARTFFRLPYHDAEMEIEAADGGFLFTSRRREGSAAFTARYRPVGEVFIAEPDSLEEFLTERYALVTVLRNGGLLWTEIHHRPWRLQPAEADIRQNTLAEAAGFSLPDDPPLLHFSERQDTLVWPPMRVEDDAAAR